MIEYWPFLIAANENWDYRIVLCPDFIEQAGRRSALRNCLDPSDALTEGIGSRNILDRTLGSVWLLFKAGRLRDGDRDAYDSAGRPLVTIGGVAIRPMTPLRRLDPTATRPVLEHALSEIEHVLAQVRSSETTPTLMLSERQSYRGAEICLGEDGTAPPEIEIDNTSERTSVAARPSVLQSKVAKAAIPVAIAAFVGIGWLSLHSGDRNIKPAEVAAPSHRSLIEIEADLGWQHDLSMAYSAVGAMLEKQGDLHEALQSHQDSLTVMQHLVRLAPENAGWQRDLESSRQRVARLNSAVNHAGPAPPPTD